MTYFVQPAKPEEVEKAFDLYRKRVQWMDEVGIKHWNVYDYLSLYPISYFKWQQRHGYLFLLLKDDSLIGSVVLRDHDCEGVWRDKSCAHAYYIRNLVTDPSEKGAGRLFLSEIEKKALADGAQYLRLDCSRSNTALNEYYRTKGYNLRGTLRRGEYLGNKWEKNLTLE